MQRLLIPLLFLLCSSALANEFPIVGGYGFNWLAPTASRCQKITKADLAMFKICEFHPAGNAFGLSSRYHFCHAGENGEFLVYESRERCVEAHETMKAHEP